MYRHTHLVPTSPSDDAVTPRQLTWPRVCYLLKYNIRETESDLKIGEVTVNHNDNRS
jgi:hypothetical protein